MDSQNIGIAIGGVVLLGGFLLLILSAGIGAWWFLRKLGKRSAFPEADEFDAGEELGGGSSPDCSPRGPHCQPAEVAGDATKLVGIRIRSDCGCGSQALSRERIQKIVDAIERRQESEEESELLESLAALAPTKASK